MKKFLKWLDNYWYHYKWPTVIFAAFAVFIVIMVTQFVTREEYDVAVLYAGPLNITPNQARDAETEISKLIDSDLNGDGKKNCQITPFYLLTDEQASALQAEYDAKEELYFVNRAELASTQQKFTNQISAGDGYLLLLDPYWYGILREQDLIVPLDEALGMGDGEISDISDDGYSILLSDTSFARFFTAMHVFPDDTLICLRRIPTASAFTGKSDSEKHLEYTKKLLRAMIDYSVGSD